MTHDEATMRIVTACGVLSRLALAGSIAMQVSKMTGIPALTAMRATCIVLVSEIDRQIATPWQRLPARTLRNISQALRDMATEPTIPAPGGSLSPELADLA